MLTSWSPAMRPSVSRISPRITARSDDLDEQPFEELILTLTNPTGGAILGAQASASVSIVDPTPPGGSRGGSRRLARTKCSSGADLLFLPLHARSSVRPTGHRLISRNSVAAARKRPCCAKGR